MKQEEELITMDQPEMKHPRMPRAERAAQFSPFAALTGFDDMVEETGREHDEMTE